MQNYTAGIRGHYHESSDCFEYPQESLLKSNHPKKHFPNFPAQTNPRIKNFKPKKILRWGNIIQWALCSWRSHGTKSAMLESKLSTGTSGTKRLHQDKFAFSLLWMSQCVACSPAWWILYHVTASCKGPIDQ